MSIYRILVVDDEEDVRTVLRMTLGQKYEVVEAHDGLDALEKLDRSEPDFVVLDVMMPLMDGFETCRAIRNHPGYRDAPVLFLSVFSDQQARKTGYGAGANLFMGKPFDSNELVSTVDFFLERSETPPRHKRHSLEELREWEKRLAKGVAPADLPPAAEAASAGSAVKPVPRVMIVSDQAATVQSLGQALSAEFDIVSARSSLEAIDRIIMHKPDFIILDGGLPGRSAFELCALIRRNQFYRSTPLLMLTAKGGEHEEEYCRQIGVNEVISRPHDPANIHGRLVAYANAPGFAVRPKDLTTEIYYPHP
jgi:DNA-binding response OmpR family regulator